MSTISFLAASNDWKSSTYLFNADFSFSVNQSEESEEETEQTEETE